MRILISGGGIAGNAAAHWLDRGGFEVVVVERAAAPRPGGQAVDLRGASRGVVEHMGLMPGIRQRQLSERGLRLVDADGATQALMPAESLGGAGAVADIEISRGDLGDLLLGAAGRAEHRYGDHLTALEDAGAYVEVTFASGTRERYDLVIGADGLHSATRAMVFGPEEDFAHPLGGIMSFFTMPTPFDLEGWFHMHAMPGAVALGLRPDRDPRTCKAVVTIRTPERPPRDPGVQKAFIAKHLQGRTWQAAAVLAALDSADDFYFDVLEQIRMPGFTRGRIALLGDAAYCGSPLTGHGTALALVGAYVLAGELAGHRGDHRTALARYEQTMRPFIERGHRLPPGGLKSMTPQTALGIRLGTLLTWAMTSELLKPLMARMVKAPADELLPDYDLPEAQALALDG